MIGEKLLKSLDVGVVNLESLLKEVSKRRITAFLRVTYWGREDFLLFLKGEPLKYVSISNHEKRELKPPGEFRLSEKEGTVSLVECTLDDITGFLSCHVEPERSGSLILFPWGEPVQEPTSLNFIDIEKELLLARRSHLSGYMALYTRDKLLGIVVFYEGEPVAVFGGNGTYGKEGIAFINENLVPAKSYMSMYALEHEVMPFLYSLNKARILSSHVGRYEEAKERAKDIGSGSLILAEGGGMRRYDFFFRGANVMSFLKDNGFFITDEEELRELSAKVEGMPDVKVSVYEVPLVENPEPIKVVIEPTSPDTDKLLPETVRRIKSLFIKKIGPIGRLIWSKTLEELGIEEEAVGRKEVLSLIERLGQEIPEEDAREDFLHRCKEIV